MRIINWIKYKLGPEPHQLKQQRTVLTLTTILDPKNAKKNPDGTTTISSNSPHPALPKTRISQLGLPESEVMRWLIKKRHIENVLKELFNDHTQPKYYKTEVKEPFTIPKQKPGDIDLFVFQNPELAVGIECKVIKNTYVTNINSKLNKIDKIKDAWEQLEGYRKIGFNRTYLLLIVLDDQSHNKAQGQLSRKLNEQTVLKQDVLQTQNDSGIIVAYINQFTEYHFEFANTVSCELIRNAVPQVQLDILTKKIDKNQFSIIE